MKWADEGLETAQRLLKTDMRYLLSGGSWLTLGQVGISLMAFLISIAFAHFVSKETYGTYRFLQSLFWTLSAFTLTGLPTALTQAIARGYEGDYRRGFLLCALWSMPMAVASIGLAAYYFFNNNATLGYGSLIIAALGPLLQSSLLFGVYLEGKQDFRRYAIYGLILNASPTVLTLLTMMFTDSALAFFVAYLIGNIVTGLLLGIYVYWLYRPNFRTNPHLLSLGAHFSAMNLLTTISQQIDKILVFHYLGAAQLAIYTFALAIPEQLKGVLSNVATLAFPKFSRRPIHEIEANFWGRLLQYILMLGVISALYIVFAPLVFKLILPTYMDSVFYSQVFAISLFGISNLIPLTLLQAHAAKTELYIYNVLSPLFQIGTLIALTATFGLIGTVAARIAGRIFNLALLAILVRYYAARERGDGSHA